MAYNTKPILVDVNGNPVSQYYNALLDRYEVLEGVSGGNKVILYRSDGTENKVSLIPILAKLNELTGAVVDEETRKANEIERIVLYDDVKYKLDTGQLKGDQGIQGIKGNQGDSGVSVDVSGHYYFSVEGGDLYVNYPDGGTQPNFVINPSGDLIYTM